MWSEGLKPLMPGKENNIEIRIEINKSHFGGSILQLLGN